MEYIRDDIKRIVLELEELSNSDDSSLALLLGNLDGDEREFLRERADLTRKKHYSDKVYLRGLIEFTSCCRNDCYYCGLRKSNSGAQRFRLSEEEILDCCKNGYHLGFRTFVLQGGEDPYFTDDRVCSLVSAIRKDYPDCAITLSIGEKSYNSYKRFFEAGANRYLLRHETADSEHYRKLHPEEMSLENRKECLFNLKQIGYQVGAGFMVGSPFQTIETIISDLRFLQELKPDMIGAGPFVSHSHTPFANSPNGSVELTLKLISILRLMFPYALIPSTTALGTIHPSGRELGLKAGANVVMPNLSPIQARKKYELYDNKIITKEEAAEGLESLKKRISEIGYRAVSDRGDVVAH